ncbi:MAG: hypothetical protein K0R57_4049 [Paenibacillaceae bacterium]|nr:hypothetical protein [Paenibacillaceae bacterium]
MLTIHFNPRTPNGVRRLLSGAESTQIAISIHALQTECDNAGCRISCAGKHFNPRTPNGVRRRSCCVFVSATSISIHALQTECDNIPLPLVPQLLSISIHALQTECDRGSDGNNYRVPTFQSTHSKRSATSDWYDALTATIPFQSTHSKRSATLL